MFSTETGSSHCGWGTALTASPAILAACVGGVRAGSAGSAAAPAAALAATSRGCCGAEMMVLGCHVLPATVAVGEVHGINRVPGTARAYEAGGRGSQSDQAVCQQKVSKSRSQLTGPAWLLSFQQRQLTPKCL